MRDESQPALSSNGANGAHPEFAARSLPELPQNLAAKCPSCRELLLGRDLAKNLQVCPRCDYHFRLSAPDRIELIADEDSFEDLTPSLPLADPLHFSSRTQTYLSKLEKEQGSTGAQESVMYGRVLVDGLPLIVVVMDFRFIGGSMGTLAGEFITEGIERARNERTPLMIVSASGGARMQEGMLALMQMAKTTIALSRLAAAGVPYISLLTDPTTGGVPASFAMLGDINLAEPGALIGFTGPRVIEGFMHMRLPKDVNTAEFVLQHGMLDGIVHRRELKATLARLLRMYSACAPTRA